MVMNVLAYRDPQMILLPYRPVYPNCTASHARFPASQMDRVQDHAFRKSEAAKVELDIDAAHTSHCYQELGRHTDHLTAGCNDHQIDSCCHHIAPVLAAVHSCFGLVDDMQYRSRICAAEAVSMELEQSQNCKHLTMVVDSYMVAATDHSQC